MATPEKIIGQVAYELLAQELTNLIKTKANTSHTHAATDITQDATHKFVTDVQIADWNAKVTTEQLNQAIKTFSSGLAWKGVYDTLADLTEAIPTPKEGDFVIVIKESSYQSKNTLLIYEGEPSNRWQTVGELFVPGVATQSQDGLMSKTDKQKLDGLNNYTLPVANTEALGGVKAKSGGPITIGTDGTIDIAATKLVADGERDKWNTASTNASSALSKANANAGEITTLQGKVSTLEGKLVLMTTEEAQQIIDAAKA